MPTRLAADPRAYPRNQISPTKGARGLETLAMDRDSGHPANPVWVESDRRFRAQRREEDEAAALPEKLRLEKRERRKKQRREKKRRQKKELREKELQLQRPSASSSGAIGLEEGTSEVRSLDVGPLVSDTSRFETLLLDDEALMLDTSYGIEASEVTSNEVGLTRLETLSLNDSSPTLDSTVGAVMHASDMGSGLSDSTIIAQSADEALSPRSAELREHEEYLKEHTFDTIEDLFEFFCNSQRAARAMNQAASEQSSLENFESQPVLESEEAQPVQAPEEARQVLTREEARPEVAAQGQYSEGSNSKEVARAGMKWMTEEVMVAFKKYHERKDDLKECDYKIDELCNQCFSVENYNHIFHHFNFTVNMKTAGSTDWTSVLYFAEVKGIFGRKIYFCCPLEPEENGHCYACKNQGIDDLKHPIIGAFDRGSPDSTFPFMYDAYSDDDDDNNDDDVEEYNEAWRMRMRAAGVMVG